MDDNESFTLVLPSNASGELFPKNTPSDFIVHLNNPIQLEGQWEVGVQSISYSAAIGDADEKAEVELSCKWKKVDVVNDLYLYQYKVSSDNKWLGYKGFVPKTFEENATKWMNVIKTLNSINDEITVDGRKVFEFTHKRRKLVFNKYDDALDFQLSPAMERYSKVYFYNVAKDLRFDKDDYKIFIHNKAVVEKHRRIVLKEVFESVPVGKVEEYLINTWKERVHKQAKIDNIQIEIKAHNKKLILYLFSHNLAVTFSEDFYKRFRHPESYFRRGEFWAYSAADLTTDCSNEYWYIDIYLDELAMTKTKKISRIPFSLKVREFYDIRDVAAAINRISAIKMKEIMKLQVLDEQHKFDISIVNNKSKLTIGSWIRMQWSKNLAYMFGFDEKEFSSGDYNSIKHIGTLNQLESYLFITTNLIQPTAYGDQKLRAIQDFVHEHESSSSSNGENTNKNELIEKSFYPMTFFPVSNNYINEVRVQITNELMQPIKIIDSKTLLIFYFRKMI